MRRRRAVIAPPATAVLALQAGGWLLHGIGSMLLRLRRRIVIILIIREVLLIKVVIQKAFQVQVMLIGLAKLIGFGIDADQPAMR